LSSRHGPMKQKQKRMPASRSEGLFATLVSTKLTPPTADPRSIVRPNLLMEEGAAWSPVTSIVAPAGSGKSTLMAQLYHRFAARGIPNAWLSLDADDDDPATFAIYFISALHSHDPGFGEDELIALEANPLRDFEPLFDRLIGRITAVDVPRAVFFDDVQYIRNKTILRFLDKLLAHLPPGLHLVFASRSLLPLALTRMRVSGRLIEVGRDELNFDRAQAGRFLKEYHELELSTRDLEALLESTEGWPTGLQLAALALRRHKGPAAELIKTFSGRDRDLTGYLVESVLRTQAEGVRLFLLRTSPLRRMCADLCRAATDQPDAEDLLDYVGRANLFLIPLDRDGVWFRYHHLFTDFLQTEFRRTYPDEYRKVCDRAAKWCEANDQTDEAVRYALDAENYGEAADLIARHAPHASMYRGDHYTVLNWLGRLPAEYHDRHPEILLAQAWSCAFSRETAKAMEVSQRSLQLLDAGRWKLTADQRDRYEMQARNVQAATQACADAIEDCLARASELRYKVPETQPFIIATLSNCLAYSHFIKRDFVRSQSAAVDAHEFGHRSDAAYLSAWGDFLHGLADVELGQLKEAAIFGRGVHKDSQGLGLGQKSYVAGLSALLDSEIAIQHCDFERARESIEIGRAFKEIFGPSEPQLVAIRNEARLLAYSGPLDEARVVLQDGQDAALREQHMRLHLSLAIEETSLQLSSGDVSGAAETARKWRLRALATDSAERPELLKAQREALRLLEARFLLAEERHGPALRLLTALQQSRGAEQRGGFFLSVSANRALAMWGQGKPKDAARHLDSALQTAAPEFHVWPLVSAGRNLLPVLDAIGDFRGAPGELSAGHQQLYALHGWVKKWLSGERDNGRPAADGALAEKAKNAALVEALTSQEVRLLKLLQSGYDNRRLANALLLSESTVKWHLHNVYSKLGVKSRGEAVAMAAQTGLL
jgi:ATP/maltotriose-dependent transcriptional regulator MalT